jgi:hypothetical protein
MYRKQKRLVSGTELSRKFFDHTEYGGTAGKRKGSIDGTAEKQKGSRMYMEHCVALGGTAKKRKVSADGTVLGCGAGRFLGSVPPASK